MGDTLQFIDRVAVSFTDRKDYPVKLPFNPPCRYPELTCSSFDEENDVYEGVRDLLRCLGLDKEHFGTEAWNPFGDFVRPGMTVFVKPNTVTHLHEGGKDIRSAIIHASILRPVLDYICIALKGAGKITVGDSQLLFSSFPKAMKESRIEELIAWYKEQTTVKIECLDLRMVRGARTWLYGKWKRVPINQDPLGYVAVDLSDRSAFKGIDPSKLRIAVASYKEMRRYHTERKHAYVFPRSFLESDVIFNVAKLKTHRRTGVTLCIKNFMGLPALKDCLPHFTVGSPSEGGDQYINPSARKRLCTRLHDRIQSEPGTVFKFVTAVAKKLVWNSHWIVPFRDDVFEAMWPGNDTLWRTLSDLNRIAVYSDKTGKVCDQPQRSVFCLIDGIIGGEKDGPLAPSPIAAGALVAGTNTVAVDAVATTLMGFDLNKIPVVARLIEKNDPLPLWGGKAANITVVEGGSMYNLDEYRERRNLRFEAHPAWKGQIELPTSKMP